MAYGDRYIGPMVPDMDYSREYEEEEKIADGGPETGRDISAERIASMLDSNGDIFPGVADLG